LFDCLLAGLHYAKLLNRFSQNSAGRNSRDTVDVQRHIRQHCVTEGRLKMQDMKIMDLQNPGMKCKTWNCRTWKSRTMWDAQFV